MSQEIVQPCWANAEWLAEVREWVTEQAAQVNREVIGAITQPHVRPWSTVMRVPTDSGILWFKATSPTLPHESAVTEALSRWAPGRTPHVLSFQPKRNWLLMADEGVTLRSIYQVEIDHNQICKVAEGYAALQKSLVPRTDAILALGVPDCRLAILPGQYAALLDNSYILRVGEEDCLSESENSRLCDLTPFVETLCSELAAFGIPETLQHDDLHSNNILVRGDESIVFDWGDFSISHPFYSLVVLLRGAARDFDMPEDSPEVARVREAYLAAWDLPLTHIETDRMCAVSDALGRISRALTWQRVLRGMSEPHSSYYVSAPSGWLQEFLEAAQALRQ